MFGQLYTLLKSDHNFKKGIEVEVLYGFYQYIPLYKLKKIGYRQIRLK